MLPQNGCHELKTTPVFAHPLLRKIEPIKSSFISEDNPLVSTSVENNIDERVNGTDFIDPLGASDGHNTLSKIRNAKYRHRVDVPTTHRIVDIDSLNDSPLRNTLNDEKEESSTELDHLPSSFTSWRELRATILQEFRTIESLSLESSFLQPSNNFIAESIQEKQRSIIGNSTETLKFCDISQDDYVKKFGELQRVFHRLWQQQKRIDCIRLIIEVARTLSTVSVPQFYPSQFVYVTDLLDDFGSLVYQRLRSRAESERNRTGVNVPLSHDFAIVEVLEHTRITARNWFGKIGEIRELIPRIYEIDCNDDLVECALLRCMRFMDPDAIQSNLMRLCELVCFCQHPLIASYARSYICRVALRVDFTNRAPGWKCLNDWLQTYNQQPTFLLWPAMQYIIECVSQGAITHDDLSPLWEYCRLPEKRSIVLCAMLNGVSHFYLAENALEACKLVIGSEHVTGDEICAFGVNLLKAQVAQAHRKPILKAIWKCIMRLASLKSYVHCCDVWMEFVTRYFTVNELEIILENLMKKLLPEKKFELYYDNLLSILDKILIGTNVDLIDVLALDVFVQFMNLFRGSHVRRKSATLVLGALVARHTVGSITDFTIAYQIKDICKLLNDGLSIFSSMDERENDSRLIRRSLDRVNLLDDPEQSLTYYAACRAVLLNNDDLVQYVIKRILGIGLHVVRTIRYTTARSTFVYACLVNLFITIPSLTDGVERFRLSVHSAQLALSAMAFLQLNEFINFALDVLEEISVANEEFARLRIEMLNFFGFLWNTPNMCEMLEVFSRTLRTINSWQTLQLIDQARLQLDCLQFLIASANRLQFLSTNAIDFDALRWFRLSPNEQKTKDSEIIVKELINETTDRLLKLIQTDNILMVDCAPIRLDLTDLVKGLADPIQTIEIS